MRTESLLPLLIALVSACIVSQVLLALFVTDTLQPLGHMLLALIHGLSVSGSMWEFVRDTAAQVTATVFVLRYVPKRWGRKNGSDTTTRS